MEINKEKKALYRKTMEDAKEQLGELDTKMEQEIQKIREKLAELQEAKRLYKQVYEGTAELLGVEVEETSENSNHSSLKLEEIQE